MRPMIGIVPLVDYEKESYWMLPGYMGGILAAGGIPVMLPLADDAAVIMELVEKMDGFLFTGGQDVSPKLYGEEKLPQCGECSIERDRMEKNLLEAVLDADKPVLGICRGIQFINAALGGTLYQDLPSQHPGEVEHHMTPPYDREIHRVSVVEGTFLAEIMREKVIGVNSYHHQAVKRLASCLKTAAVSEDGLIEALYMPDKKWVAAVQWHPEFSYQKDPNAAAIFERFVKAAVK
ncbi:MAG: gamma-glutamyl-gamma-aminobutyrate hydrolase family protein [bacterium]|nr:gamma-glutamyl-gamma-aminobutyrate hydrolase family protein [bacterium]